jgi:hypothetical protein
MHIDSNAVWEFFSPFAHIPGKYEWCRIHSPTHGSFDCFIVLGESTAVPPEVYVNSEAGERFMAERYPESAAFRVAAERLRLRASADGRLIRGSLRAETGPVRRAELRLRAEPHAIPSAVPYGGSGFPVWGGRWACEGVDLVLDGRCDGTLRFQDGRVERLRNAPCVVTAGSFARIVPLVQQP